MSRFFTDKVVVPRSILRPDVMCTHTSYFTFFATSLLAEGEEFARSERADTALIGPDGEEIDPYEYCYLHRHLDVC